MSTSENLWPKRIIFGISVLLILFGFKYKTEYWISPNFGFGYTLGIVGSIAMLLLLVYPLVKRGFLRVNPKTIRIWFGIHMLLGIFGPLAILFHSNFSLGATNSNIALSLMLCMVASGFVGRYIYSRIHLGLYGNKASLSDLNLVRNLNQQEISRNEVQLNDSVRESISKNLAQFEAIASQMQGVSASFIRAMTLSVMTRLYFWRLLRIIRKRSSFLHLYSHDSVSFRQNRKKLSSDIKQHLQIVRRIAELSFYERLFALWHVLHMPIFFMLLLTGIVHVVSVHMY